MNYKKKICKTCGKETYIFSHGNCKFCASKLYKSNPKSPDTLSYIMNEADRTFSLYKRLGEADKNGMITCYICKSKVPFTEAQLMHYVKRDNKMLRYSEVNCHVGCATCNCTNDGNLEEYRKELVKEYGESVITELEGIKSDKMDRNELIANTEFWKNVMSKWTT